jgi:lantibiotic modifying enzyme
MRALQLQSCRSHASVERSLRRSLGLLVRRQLREAISLPAQRATLPLPLQPYVPAVEDLNADSLRRFASRRAAQWSDSMLELLQRLDGDWNEIVPRFDLHADVTLAAVSAPLGDLHNDGRSVYKLAFSDGRALIYKPRSVETEDLVGRLVDWLGSNGCALPLKHYRSFARNDYGWTEYVPTTYSRTEDEAFTFYRRQGAFLALFWLLCAKDVIGDNIVVSREYPYWVDTECMSSPDLSNIIYDYESFPDWIRHSVLTTGMILMGIGRETALREHTGLSVSCTESRSDVFTERGVLRRRYIEAVAQGFEETYRLLWARKAQFMGAHGPLGFCDNARVRVVLRGTALYASLVKLLATAMPQHREQVEMAIEQILRHGHRPGYRRCPDEIVRAEMRAIALGDIPYWWTITNSRDLWEAGGTHIGAIAALTCMECIELRAQRMSESDLGKQSWLLRSFLAGSDPQPTAS